jgi:mannitol/fructose-specific phosphotransferase system IIA component
LRFEKEIDWAGDPVLLAIGIASANDDHVDTLGVIAEILMDKKRKDILFNTKDPQEIIELVEKAFN